MPVAVIGYTGSGKSRMMREVILPAWRKQRVAALVLDPVGQGWGAPPPWVWQTRDPDTWLAKCQQSRRCVLVMDECALHVGQGGMVAKTLAWAPCTSRNNGHMLYMLGQRTMHLPPSYRSQCSEAFLFWQPELREAEEAAVMAGQSRAFGAAVHQLPLGQCYHVLPRQPPRLIKVF